MQDTDYELGMIGLGVMGRNFLLNLADHGYKVIGYDKDEDKVESLRNETGEKTIGAALNLDDLVHALQRPRAVLMLVPAGAPVDSVIGDLLTRLEPGDLIIDGGNSHFSDTNLRIKKVGEKRLEYLGVGISGGEYGARHGPSIMPGGSLDGYRQVAAMLQSAAANVGGDPCVAYLGPRSAGHYVKMVHNGIEYGLMQLIAETYDLMKRGLALDDKLIADVYQQWNETELSGYLVEITARIFRREDPRTDKYLIDVILDEARQKGTGMWTSQDAMELQIPVPTIDTAVAMRHLSAMKDQRDLASREAPAPKWHVHTNTDSFLQQLRHALFASMVVTYAQGMALLHRASNHYEYALNLADVARIWRGGCIIRAAILDEIREAFAPKKQLANLLLDQHFCSEVVQRQEPWRSVVQTAVRSGIPVPAMAASLAYFDGYRSQWLPANLIEAQRDFFGAHTFERIDAKGVFHTEWAQPPTTSMTEHFAAGAAGHS